MFFAFLCGFFVASCAVTNKTSKQQLDMIQKNLQQIWDQLRAKKSSQSDFLKPSKRTT